ncbi:MAG: hypothetical protein KC912_18620 [Proteobacteria bacterium]|nr:hypothetical protein [Pseudomonadota bacterium]
MGELVFAVASCDLDGLSADVQGAASTGSWFFDARTDAPVDRVRLTMVERSRSASNPGPVEGKTANYAERHELVPDDDARLGWSISLDEIWRPADYDALSTTNLHCADGLQILALRIESIDSATGVIDCAIGGEHSASYFARLGSEDCLCIDKRGCDGWSDHAHLPELIDGGLGNLGGVLPLD